MCCEKPHVSIINELIEDLKRFPNEKKVIELTEDNYTNYFECCKKDEPIKLFRGIKQDGQLFPTILRSPKIKDYNYNNFICYEAKIYEKYDSLSIQYLPYYGYAEDWLASGQHWGLPTRLLDWTYDPYVALYFALDNSGEYDYDVYLLETEPKHKINGLLGFKESVDNDISQNKRLFNLYNNIKYIDSEPGSESQTNAFLYNIAKHINCIQEAKIFKEPIFLETHDSNPRLVAQSGIFEICRFPESKENVKKLKEFHQEVLKNSINKIYVIHKDKFDVLKEILRRKRINRAKLFPDLQNICKYISETV